jgi:hypothetical protein
LIGFSHVARMLFVVHAERGTKIRIISGTQGFATAQVSP